MYSDGGRLQKKKDTQMAPKSLHLKKKLKKKLIFENCYILFDFLPFNLTDDGINKKIKTNKRAISQKRWGAYDINFSNQETISEAEKKPRKKMILRKNGGRPVFFFFFLIFK